MGKEKIVILPWGWFTIYFNEGLDNSAKIDVLVLKGLFQIHKQVEQRDGLTFMRIKKRKVE